MCKPTFAKLKEQRFQVEVEKYLTRLRSEARIWTLFTGNVSADALLGRKPRKRGSADVNMRSMRMAALVRSSNLARKAFVNLYQLVPCAPTNMTQTFFPSATLEAQKLLTFVWPLANFRAGESMLQIYTKFSLFAFARFA